MFHRLRSIYNAACHEATGADTYLCRDLFFNYLASAEKLIDGPQNLKAEMTAADGVYRVLMSGNQEIFSVDVDCRTWVDFPKGLLELEGILSTYPRRSNQIEQRNLAEILSIVSSKSTPGSSAHHLAAAFK